MRSCDEILELLSAALDGELTDDEQQALDEHLDACPMCRSLFVELAGLQDAAGELEQAPAGFAQQVMEQIAVHPEQERPDSLGSRPAPRRVQIPWKKWAGWAAIFAIVILAAVTLPDHLRMGSGKGDDSSSEALIDTRENTGEAENQMPDLSKSVPEETDGGISAQSDFEEPANSFDIIASPAQTAVTHCGMLVLTGGPLPEGLEAYSAVEDEEGRLVYEVPAEYYFACAADFIEGNASNVVYGEDGSINGVWDPDAEYGLIIVAFEP